MGRTKDADGKATTSASKGRLPEVMSELYSLLEPLGTEDRQRVVDSALNLLGDKPMTHHKHTERSETEVGKEGPPGDDADWKGFPAEAKRWAKRNGITRDLFDEYFHEKDGKLSVINIPDGLAGKQKMSVACYLLLGLATYIKAGDAATFDDEAARKLCETFGAYDSPNHSRIFATMKGQLTGGKKSGWQLTKPGLDAAARLLKSKEEE
jgi:hypothetical protein